MVEPVGSLQSPPPSLRDMPEEILQKIFQQYLTAEFRQTDVEALSSGRFVCKKWNRIINYELKKIYRIYNRMIEERFCALHSKLNDSRTTKRELFLHLLTDEPNLKIRFQNNHEWVKKCCKDLPLIEVGSLDIPPCFLHGATSEIHSAVSRVKHQYVLIMNGEVSQSFILALLRGADGTRVRGIHFIDTIFLPGPSGLLKSGLKGLKTLKFVTFFDCQVDGFAREIFEGVGESNSLEKFNFRGRPITPELIDCLKGSKTLKDLHLVNCEIGDKELEALGKLLSVNQNIATLNLAYNLKRSKELMALTCGKSMSLKEISVTFEEDEEEVTDEQFALLKKSFPNLQKLIV